MKIVKRVVVVFVLCLAIVGAYALLKKAPRLNVPTEDLGYLQDVGITASDAVSEGGLSGAHGDVIGAPPLVAATTNHGSSAPPSSFGLSAPNADSVAPPFAASNASSEAPAFIAAAPLPNPLSNSASFEAPAFAPMGEAPAFVPAAPATTIASPFIPPTPAPTPLPVPLQAPVSATPPLLTAPPPPQNIQQNTQQNTLSQERPPAWDGPTTNVIFVPSSSLVDPWGVSGILETKSEPLPLPESAPAAPTVPFSAMIPTPSAEPLLENAVSAEPIEPVNPVVPPMVVNSVNNPVNPVRVQDEVKTAVVDNRIKRLPVAAEELPEESQPIVSQAELDKRAVMFAASVPVDPQARIVDVGAVEKKPPVRRNDYHQTSIRKDIIFAPSPNAVNETQPVVSFAQQKPTVKEPLPTVPPVTPPTTPAEPPTAEPLVAAHSVPSTATPITSTVSAKKPETPEIEVMPFAMAEPATESKSTAAESVDPSAIRESVERFVKAQSVLVESGDSAKIRNVYIQLSKLYEHPELNDAERMFMMPLLDRLALSVIYAKNVHILEQPYVVKLGDTVDSVARSFDISPALLMKINGLTGARPLEPGTELKVVCGHFDAKLSVKHREMTLILGGLYAGRFSTALGERVENLRGEFYVSSKTDTWNEKSLTLNNGVTLYGIDDRLPAEDPQPTTIRFTRQNAKELFDILTERSVIVFED